MGICYIISAGDCHELSLSIQQDDFIIAADGGLRHLQRAGLTPDLILGDFDSLGYVPQGREILRLPCEKDVTDTHAAALEALRRGFRTVRIYGACGGSRMDHTIANLQVLALLAQQGTDAEILDGSQRIHAVSNGTLHLSAQNAGYVSVISHSERSEGVAIRGLKYEMENGCLTNTVTRGVSNEFIGNPAEISVQKGTILVFYSESTD